MNGKKPKIEQEKPENFETMPYWKEIKAACEYAAKLVFKNYVESFKFR
jgi:hypothetical protein